MKDLWPTSPRYTTAALLCVVLAVGVLMPGCASQRYLSLRRMPSNPLALQLQLSSKKGPQVTSRTAIMLRKYDLAETYDTDPRGCLEQLQNLADTENNLETVYAVAEVAYVLGKREEREKHDAEALDLFGVAVSNAYMYLFSQELDSVRNPYDPQFRGACDLYNEALESSLRLVNATGQLIPGQSYELATGNRTYEVAVITRGAWRNEDFHHFEFCSDYEIEGLPSSTLSYGLGVPLIAVRRVSDDPAMERYYPKGLSFPVTALLRVVQPRSAGSRGKDLRHHCVLELVDSTDSPNIELARRTVPLQTDLSTPLAFFLDSPQFREQSDSTLGLLNPQKTQSTRGVYMLEPYDPERIPVLMVHGLWSSPLTWMPMFNDLRSFPELRRNYQFWFYQYPTGQPFWISATQMRADLENLRNNLDPQRTAPALDEMVVVGHSMGGLVSRMQTIESGDEFWRILSDKSFNEVEADAETRVELEQALFFKPNRSIRRLVTIGTPHRGSDYANDYTRWLARKVIKLPTSMVDVGHTLVRKNPDFFRDTDLLTTNTSIDSLSPSSPIFPVMLRVPRAPWVTYNNIIGLVPEKGLIGRFSAGTDGVVSFESAHLDDAASELVVEAEHQSIHATPKAILEVRRLLIEHLRQCERQEKIAAYSEDPVYRMAHRRRMLENASSIQRGFPSASGAIGLNAKFSEPTANPAAIPAGTPTAETKVQIRVTDPSTTLQR